MSKWSKGLRFLLAFILISTLVLPTLAMDKPTLEVHFIDVGQGDSILLHSSTGTNILIDAGYSEHGKKLLVYLENLGIDKLDYIVGTHPHADHIGGFIDLLRGIEVGEVIDPGVPYSTGIFQSYLQTIRDQKIPYRTVLAGDIIPVSDSLLRLEVLAPYEDQLNYGSNVNNVSIVIRATYGDISFLFTGDAGFVSEDRLIMNGINIESTVLKVGHHGSRSSTSDLFLTVVRPEVAVIPVGDNTYGHPTPEVLSRLGWKEIEIYRNDLHGSIIVRTDGSTYDVKTEKIVQVLEDPRVNINRAPLGDLLDIPGVTYDLAREVVKYRERHIIILTEYELLNLEYMTPELLEQILPYIKLAD